MLEIDHCEQLTDQAAVKMEKLRKTQSHANFIEFVAILVLSHVRE